MERCDAKIRRLSEIGTKEVNFFIPIVTFLTFHGAERGRHGGIYFRMVRIFKILVPVFSKFKGCIFKIYRPKFQNLVYLSP